VTAAARQTNCCFFAKSVSFARQACFDRRHMPIDRIPLGTAGLLIEGFFEGEQRRN
jgi:hypothetical protein